MSTEHSKRRINATDPVPKKHSPADARSDERGAVLIEAIAAARLADSDRHRIVSHADIMAEFGGDE